MRVESNRRRNLVPLLWGVVVGIFIGAGGLLVAVQTSCGLCTHITFAQALFPYAMIADPSLNSHGLDAPLAGIQWPLYGALVGIALTSLTRKQALLVVGVLLIVHVFSVVEANRKVNAWWESKRLGGVNVLVRGAISH